MMIAEFLNVSQRLVATLEAILTMSPEDCDAINREVEALPSSEQELVRSHNFQDLANEVFRTEKVVVVTCGHSLAKRVATIGGCDYIGQTAHGIGASMLVNPRWANDPDASGHLVRILADIEREQWLVEARQEVAVASLDAVITQATPEVHNHVNVVVPAPVVNVEAPIVHISQSSAAASEPAALVDTEYVRLDQIGGLLRVSKKTMQRRIGREKNPMPDPDIQGVGGKPSLWLWNRIRPWLELDFDRELPTVFPSSR